jgi:hypothetical protein
MFFAPSYEAASLALSIQVLIFFRFWRSCVARLMGMKAFRGAPAQGRGGVYGWEIALWGYLSWR